MCRQGGILDLFAGNGYLKYSRATEEEVPEMRLYALTPLEVSQGARATQ